MIQMTSKAAYPKAGTGQGATAGRVPLPMGKDMAPSDGTLQQIRPLAAGENLFLQGDQIRSVYALRDGWAFRYQCLEDGRRQIVDFVLPGDILGLCSSAEQPYGVEALTDCNWLVVPREHYIALLARRPDWGARLIDALSAGEVRAFERITSIGRRTARERVAHLLLELVRRVQKSPLSRQKIEIQMPLMLTHIGDALGLATETVCRCLGELKRARMLRFSAGRLEILNLAGLEEIAGTPFHPEDMPGARLVA